MSTGYEQGPPWFQKVVADAEEPLRAYFQGGRIRPGTQQLLIGVLGQSHRMGKPHEELVQELETEIREFRNTGFQYE